MKHVWRVAKVYVRNELLVFPEYWVSDQGKVYSTISQSIIGGENSKISGYCAVPLREEYGEYKTYLVHRIVASSFLEREEKSYQVNHKDGDKLNNKLSNLEWVSSKQNNVHKHDTIATKRGISCETVFVCTPDIVMSLKKAKQILAHQNEVLEKDISSCYLVINVGDVQLKVRI